MGPIHESEPALSPQYVSIARDRYNNNNNITHTCIIIVYIFFIYVIVKPTGSCVDHREKENGRERLDRENESQNVGVLCWVVDIMSTIIVSSGFQVRIRVIFVVLKKKNIYTYILYTRRFRYNVGHSRTLSRLYGRQ